MNNWVNEKLLPPVMKFVGSRPIKALRDGMLYTMPFIIVGSIFLILAQFPEPHVASWMKSTGLTPYWNVAYNATFSVMAFVAVIGIAYSWVKAEGFTPLPAGILAGISFLLVMQPITPVTVGGKVVATAKQMVHSSYIDRNWMGGQGMVTAIIVGMVTGLIYTWFMKKDIRIKLPEQVPENVSASFTALIPAAVLITGWLIVYIIFDKLIGNSMTAFIYGLIQLPLQGLTDSFGGTLVLALLIPFLWFFGVHGSVIVGGILGPLLTANALANQKILDSGKTLTVANGGHIVTQQLLDQFMTVTGAGMTIGLVVFMTFFAKSRQWKDLGKLAIGPALFNINEPILFAAPIVMNPILAIPFFATPLLSAILTYFALFFGFIPLFPATIVPWTTPPIISGFLIGGWRAAAWQLLMLVMTFFIYLPFARKQDALNVAMETKG